MKMNIFRRFCNWYVSLFSKPSIAALTTTIVILTFLVTFFLKPLIDYVLSLKQQPSTLVLVTGQENSYWFEDLARDERVKISIHPIQAPRNLQSQDIPIKSFKWHYPQGDKLFMLTVENKGKGIDKNVKVDLSFDRASIDSISIHNPSRMIIIEGGGLNASYVKLLTPELLNNEKQVVEILVKGKNNPTVTAWSERLGNISEIFIYDLDFVIEKL
jgi:hypothetical protein